MTQASRRGSHTMIVVALAMTVFAIAVAFLFFAQQDDRIDSHQGEEADLMLDADDSSDEGPSTPQSESAGASGVRVRAANDPGPTESDAELQPCPNAHRTQIRLFRDAQVRPVYQHRTMLGVRITRIKDESLWSELDIDNGDLIIESSGQLIDNPQASVDLLNDLERAEILHLRIQTTEGRERFIDWRAPPPPAPETLPQHCR